MAAAKKGTGKVIGAGRNVALKNPNNEDVILHGGDEVPDWAVEKLGAHVYTPEDGHEDSDDGGDVDGDAGSVPAEAAGEQ